MWITRCTALIYPQKKGFDMEHELIQYMNLKELTPPQLDILNNLSTDYHSKLKRVLNNLVGLKIHVKCHSKEGSKKRFDVHILVISPMKAKLVSSKAWDYDFARAVHKAFKDIQSQAEHAIHKMDQHEGKRFSGHMGRVRSGSYMSKAKR